MFYVANQQFPKEHFCRTQGYKFLCNLFSQSTNLGRTALRVPIAIGIISAFMCQNCYVSSNNILIRTCQVFNLFMGHIATRVWCFQNPPQTWIMFPLLFNIWKTKLGAKAPVYIGVGLLHHNAFCIMCPPRLNSQKQYEQQFYCQSHKGDMKSQIHQG